MATCFWQRCTCPTFMPCQEHQGIWCGRFRGRVVGDLSEIRNDLVDAAFAVIRSLESRAGDADASAVAAEALQRDWERRRAELEQRYPDPDQADPVTLRGEIDALSREANAQADALQREIDGIAELTRNPERDIAFLTPNLLIPFHDADGYCDCYAGKLAKLAAAAGHLERAELALGQATRDLDGQFSEVWRAGVAYLLAGTGFVALIGLGLPPGTLFLALLLVLAVLIALIIHWVRLHRLRAAFFRAQAVVLQARLLYYRLQHVSTCQRPFDGWQTAQPPPKEERTAEEREVDRHLEEQAREAAGAER